MLIGQFTYTACQAPGPYSATPGWKVKQAIATRSGAELPAAAVQAAVRTFGSFMAPAIPALATQMDIEELPRCLRLELLDGQFRSVAHLAAAGRDHSGRDAFFAHGLIVVLSEHGAPLPVGDPVVADWGTLRPADMWGAEGWLTPYRAEAIEAAAVGAPPRPAEASPLNPERREDFVDLHPGQREFVLAAAELAMTAGVPLVVVGLPVEAAMWTSLISHLLLPTVAWTLTFSTYEGGPPGDVLRGGAPAVVGVPGSAAASWLRVPGDQAVILNPAVHPVRDSAGYRRQDGSVLPIGRWATLAEQVCLAGWESDVRCGVDDLGARVGSSLDRWPLFGLAAAVLLLPEHRLHDRPDIARLAAEVAAEHFPSRSGSEPALLGRLVDVMARYLRDQLGTAQQLLSALDGPNAVAGAVVDRLMDGYVRSLLGTRDPALLKLTPWLPEHLRLSAPVAAALIDDLDGLIRWVDAEGPEVTALVVIAVATLAERLDLLAGAGASAVERAIGDRTRSCLVPLLLGESPTVDLVDCPSIPSWLWSDVVVQALQFRLSDYRAGAALADPARRRLVDDAAGPLPSAFVPGQTLASLTLVDGERAAALLVTRQPGTGATVSSAQDEVLRAAAFLRSALIRQGQHRVPPDRLFDLLRRWFPAPRPRAEVLAELIEQLRDSAPIADLCHFANSALADLPPDSVTAAISRDLWRVPGAASYVTDNAAGWHRQFGEPVAPSSREVNLPTMPFTGPDAPENHLLDAVTAERVPDAMAGAGRERVARWILVLNAQFFCQSPPAVSTDRAPWLSRALRSPLGPQLAGLYPQVAGALIRDVFSSGKRTQTAADVVAAEWVVRSRLAAMGIDSDPASSFFQEANGRSEAWSDGVRLLLRSDSRPRIELDAWVHRVRRCAEEAGRVAALPWSPDNGRQALIDSAADTAVRLSTGAGMLGRLKWPTPRRD